MSSQRLNSPRGALSTVSKLWVPANLAPSAEANEAAPHAVCILNQPLERRNHLLRLCANASFIICADGGANRLKDLGLPPEAEDICRPDFICGDFDSVRPEVLAYYRNKGTKISHDSDQYSTDLQKCLRQLSISHGSDERLQVAIFGGLSGRADQAFSLIHQLYAIVCTNPLLGIGDIFLITRESLIFLLEKGHNRIEIPGDPRLFTPNVGILPVGRPSVITTHGLEWDVTDWATEFGGQVSTSNHIVADLVEVITTERVLFTMEWNSTSQHGGIVLAAVHHQINDH